MKNIIYKTVLGIMILFTLLDIFSLSSFLLAQGSDVMMTFVNVSVWVKILFIVVFCLTYYFRQKIRYVDAIFIIVILSWTLSGYSIVHNSYPEDKIISGWYFVRANEILVCGDNDTDCENIVNNKTVCSKLSFWRIKIKNERIDQTFFVGPLIWAQSKQSLKKIYPQSNF
ncbi:hypothetical protein FACS1894169_04670 [Bacteroidia bacterium]|nr:hypothetical protein FACS1894169_04670 [Bacteroidia bacterium]